MSRAMHAETRDTDCDWLLQQACVALLRMSASRQTRCMCFIQELELCRSVGACEHAVVLLPKPQHPREEACVCVLDVQICQGHALPTLAETEVVTVSYRRLL